MQKQIILCFALVCTLSHSGCTISQGCQSVPFSPWCEAAGRKGPARRAPVSTGTCWTRLGFCLTCGREQYPHHQLHVCVPWPAFMGLCSGHSASLPALLLGTNIEVCQNPVLAFCKVFWEPNAESTREKQTINQNSSLLVKVCTHWTLKVCSRKVKRIFSLLWALVNKMQFVKADSEW